MKIVISREYSRANMFGVYFTFDKNVFIFR